MKKRDTLFIEKFQIYSVICDIYAIKITWNHNAFDFQATISNVNFTNDLALHVRCIQCLGHNTIIVNNCSFSDTYTGEDIPTTYDYNYEDDYITVVFITVVLITTILMKILLMVILSQYATTNIVKLKYIIIH